MTSVFSGLRSAGAVIAIASVLVLSGCDKQPSSQTQSAYSLPDLPATIPLAPGQATEPVFAPAVDRLPRPRMIDAVQPADPGNYYAYADDAWGFDDALGYAPPDYGFYYDDVEPWAWQGYDDSLVFLEPLDYGYRYYYYRPGFDDPYFIRDPYYGYGYDDGRIVVIYNSYGAIVPYASYGPRLDYASRYYWRGRDLYAASHRRHAVIGANWAAREAFIAASRNDWYADRSRVAAWQDYHNRYADQRSRYWSKERTRRQADAVRFAAWRSDDFRSPPPPRAIPADWKRARWAQDERRFAPPAAGFDGNAAERRHAVAQERARVRNDRRQFAFAEGRDRDARPGERQRSAYFDRASERRELRQARIDEGARDRAERRADRLDRAEAHQSQARPLRRDIGAARDDRTQTRDQRRLVREQQAESRQQDRSQRNDRLQAAQQRRVERNGSREQRQAEAVRQARSVQHDRARQERLTQRNARAEQRRAAQETRVQARRRPEVRAEAQLQRQARQSRLQERRQSEGRARAEQQRQARQETRATAVRQHSEQRAQARSERQAQVQQARNERQQARAARQESPRAEQRVNRVETARADRPNREERRRDRP